MVSNTLSSSSEPVTLETVKLQFDHWRETSFKGKRIPKHLWEAVSHLTKHYPFNKIASELKLNPYRLQAKLEKQSKHVPSSLSEPTFIELPLPPFPLIPKEFLSSHALMEQCLKPLG